MTDRVEGQGATEPRTPVSYRLPLALVKRLRVFAAQQELKTYQVVERALAAYLDRQERPAAGEGIDG